MDERRHGLRYMVVGANHRSSAATTRDRLFVEESQAPAFLGRLREAGLHQAALLSTCARTEVQALHGDPDDAAKAISKLFAEKAGMADHDIAGQIYAKSDEDAIRHVFSVTASLDSPVLGEPQVLGQVKESHRVSVASGMSGSELDTLFQAAYGAAKRVRSETPIGERPVSMAAAALQLARDVHGDISRCNGLLVVGGEMGELIAEYLVAGGIDRMTITSRVPARAEMAARRFGCHHAPMETLVDLIGAADVIISSLGAGDFVISKETMRAAIANRRRKPVFLVDAAVPGDVEPGVNDLDEVFLYDLGDLEGVVASGRAGRDAAATEARDIIDQEISAYLMRGAARSAAPAVTALRAHFERVREDVLEDSQGRDAAEVTRRLINRLLHDPSRTLASMATSGEVGEAERLMRRMFGLDFPDPGATEDDT